MVNFALRGVSLDRRTTIDPDEMDRILADGATLPAPFYTDAGIAELEDDLVFRPSWQIVGVEPELRNVGDYFTTSIDGYGFSVPIVVLRDKELQLRAFINVCRHRAHMVCVGSGNKKSLQCGYHGWTYGLDGCLRAIPRSSEGGLPPFEQLGLHPLTLDTWKGYIFVSLCPEEALGDALGEFPTVLESQGFEFPFAPENVDPRIPLRAGGDTDERAGQLEGDEREQHRVLPLPGFAQAQFLGHVQGRPGALQPPRVRPWRLPHHLVPGLSRRVARHHRPGEASGVPVLLPLAEHVRGRRDQPAGLWRQLQSSVAGRSGRLEGRDRPLPDAGHEILNEEVAKQIAEWWQMTIDEDRDAAGLVQTGLKSGMYTWGYTLPESERNMRHFYALVWKALAPAFRA